MNLRVASRVRTIRKLVASAIFSLGMVLGLSTPAHAQAMDPCTVYLCMAGISWYGASGGPGCIPSITYWHAVAPAGLAVYDYWGFDAISSYALRSEYLMSCPGADAATNLAIVETILSIWGSVP